MRKFILALFIFALFQSYTWAQAVIINFGDLVTGTINIGEKKFYSFNGFSGTTVRIGYDSYYEDLELISPTGDTIYSQSNGYDGCILTEQNLTENGTYTIVIYTHSGYSEPYTLGLYQMSPPLETNVIAADTLLTGTVKRWEKKFYTFNGASGTTVRVGYDANYYEDLELISPTGDTIYSQSNGYDGCILTEQNLTENGTYTIVIYTHSGYSEPYTLGLYQMSPTLETNVIAADTLLTGTVKRWEKKFYTFNGASGTTVRVGYDANYYEDLELISPTGDTIYGQSNGYDGCILTEQNLTENGTYTIVIYTHNGNISDFYTLGFYQVDPLPIPPDTIIYEQEYYSTIPYFGKKIIKFQGVKDVTIRLANNIFSNGGDISGNIKTPNGEILLSDLQDEESQVREIILPETGIYTITLEATTMSNYGYGYYCKFWIYQVDPLPIPPDTITYEQEYYSTIPYFGKKIIKFQGVKDVTIRLANNIFSNGGDISGNIKTPNDEILLSDLQDEGSQVREIILPETGIYTITLEATTMSNYGYGYYCKFWIYQVDPLPIPPDTITYEQEYYSTIPYFGKKIIKFQGVKDVTIRLANNIFSNGGDISGNIKTPNDEILLSDLQDEGSQVREIILPETGIYTITLEATTMSNYGYGYYCKFWIYKLFPPANTITLSFEETVSGTITAYEFRKPIIYQFAGEKDDLVLVENFLSDRDVEMVLYNGFCQPMDTITSNTNVVLDTTLNRGGIYYLVCTSLANSTTTFSYSFNLWPKYKILSYSTNKVGNYGKSTIIFEGNGFGNNSTISLARTGQDTINADTLTLNRFKCSALFDFNQKTKGKWDIIINFGDTIVIIKEGLEIEDYKAPEIEVELIGQSYVRPNMYTYYTINYRNIGNVNAYEIPLSIQLTSTNEVAVKEGWENYVPDFGSFYTPIPDDFSFKNVDNETGEVTKYLAPTIPIIPPGGYGSLTFGVKMNHPTEIKVNAGSPVYKIDPNGSIVPNQDFFDCFTGIGEVAKDQLVELGIDAIEEVVPGFSCALSVGGAIVESQVQLAENRGVIDKPLVGNFVVNLAKAGMDCAISAIPGDELIAKIWEVYKLANDENILQTLSSCNSAFNQGKSNYIAATIVTSIDPNDKIGYRSPSGSRYFNNDKNNFTYIINFENKETATAPAQEISITDTLDLNSFDVNSFRTGNIIIGSKIVQAPYSIQDYTWEVDMRPEFNLLTKIQLSLDKSTGIVHWYLMAVDPITDTLPTNPLVGFLPPNDSLGSGQGSVSFSINLKDGIGNGGSINNRASIVFDYNDPIFTPIWCNTKDIIAPVSTMSQPVVSDSMATISWQAEDNQGGSGVYAYNVFVKKAGEDYHSLLSYSPLNSVEFKYKKNIEYSFYVTATDSAGNEEVKTNIPEVTLLVNGIAKHVLQNVTMSVYPNPSQKNTGVTVAFNISDNLLKNGQLVISTLNGSIIKIIPLSGKEMMVNDLTADTFIFTLRIGNEKVVSQKVVIK